MHCQFVSQRYSLGTRKRLEQLGNLQTFVNFFLTESSLPFIDTFLSFAIAEDDLSFYVFPIII